MLTAVTPSCADVTTTDIPVASPSNRDGWPFTMIFVAGVTLYSFAACVAYLLIAIEVRWTAVMWSVVSGEGVGECFFDLPAPNDFDGNSSATASNAAMAGKNFTPPILKQPYFD